MIFNIVVILLSLFPFHVDFILLKTKLKLKCFATTVISGKVSFIWYKKTIQLSYGFSLTKGSKCGTEVFLCHL